jgi:hypothetical protein
MANVKRRKSPGETCLGCGHLLSRHREYARGGVNKHGCRLVCIADNCGAWTECYVIKAGVAEPSDQTSESR